ncbi:MFS general substrate transporter [Macroventuria anomochaeta]|uniref:MFS general substrate transporter n=1 Tax=Macroventuria anomochaeta TaxID=301207 RepID=A0ACB6SIC7_9PLEO|nr:MFS general substrate transporter [Macroventuria anomochaeta]KAF2633748.1 MFS general substrate transporter [Macroventuria anomochaeta]
MEKSDSHPRLPLRPLRCLARAYPQITSDRPSSSATPDKERSTIRKDIQQLYRNEELPSIYHHTVFDLPKSFDDDGDRLKKDIYLVDWDHNLDPQNPLNWPAWKKSLNIACIFLMCIISPFTSSVFAPAIPSLMLSFHTTEPYLSSFVLSVYVLGYAIGPLVISPLSELFGRIPLYHFCNTLFSICTLLCGRTTSTRTLAVTRLFAGMGGSSVFALAPSSVADMFPEEKRGAVMAVVAVGYNLGPSISPTAGAYINAAWGWEWVFYISGGLGLIVTVLNFAGLSESYEPVLLRRKAARLRKQKRFRDGSVRSRFDFDVQTTRREVLGRAMLMPLRMLVFSKTILLTSALTAIGYGWMYILYTTLPTTFLVMYAWEPKSIGFAYLGTAVGAVVGMVVGAKISDAVMKRRKEAGDFRPENRLLPMFFFWPCVGVGLLIYAWAAQNTVHWALPVLGTSIFGAGAMSAIFFTGTYILDAYPVHSASGTAASTLFRSILGGIAPLFSNKLYKQLDVGWMFSLLAFVALAVAPVPWIVYGFGEGWRKKENLGGNIAVGGREVRNKLESKDADTYLE